MYVIAPSILSADFSRLGKECEDVISAGGDWIHFDVMDNHYVPNLTIGPLVCSSLKKYGIKAPIDVHLMVKPCDSLIGDFAESGADWITIHPESTEHLDRSLRLIKDSGCKAGISLNPSTSPDCLDYIIDIVDMILVMSVNPGFGRQKFIDSSITKIKTVREKIKNSGRDIRLEVDGGITASNIAMIAAAGADTFVSGSAIFGSSSYSEAIGMMRKALKA
ncbi:MAG TPA: ribulose-phosphate 3-epimerase [Spirochaetota bacterium]|nr:ribulose-phosphate 3-epimerase [Spirochaetota bacterium]